MPEFDSKKDLKDKVPLSWSLIHRVDVDLIHKQIDAWKKAVDQGDETALKTMYVNEEEYKKHLGNPESRRRIQEPWPFSGDLGNVSCFDSGDDVLIAIRHSFTPFTDNSIDPTSDEVLPSGMIVFKAVFDGAGSDRRVKFMTIPVGRAGQPVQSIQRSLVSHAVNVWLYAFNDPDSAKLRRLTQCAASFNPRQVIGNYDSDYMIQVDERSNDYSVERMDATTFLYRNEHARIRKDRWPAGVSDPFVLKLKVVRVGGELKIAGE
jgi:hypothetical protein